MTSGWKGAPQFTGETASSWFQNRRFRERKVGGATVERLRSMSICCHATTRQQGLDCYQATMQAARLKAIITEKLLQIQSCV